MKSEVKLPKHGLNMTKGLISEFNVKIGDMVKKGDILFTVETDKATLEVESLYTGVVSSFEVEEGEEIPVDSVVMIISDIEDSQSKSEESSVDNVVNLVDNEVKLPKHGLNMTKGLISEFLVEEGENVKRGDILYSVETDKATLEVESPFDGVVKELCVEEGDEVSVGQVVMIIQSKVSDSPATVNNHVSKSNPSAKATSKEKEKVLATPAARRMAMEKKLDLEKIAKFTGKKVVDNDSIREYLTKNKPCVEKTLPEYVPEFDTKGKEKVELTNIKKISIQRLTYSFREIPHFYLSLEANISNLLVEKERLLEEEDLKISLSDFITLAVAKSLAEYPLANASFYGDAIYLNPEVNVGLATATSKGLLVPVIFNANNKTLSQIAEERKNIVKKALAGKLTLTEMENGTFTISNLGLFGIKSFNAVINPPQAAILTVGSIENKVKIENGDIVSAPMLNMGLAVDHRVLDGSEASEFFSNIKKLLDDVKLLGI